MAGIGSSRPRAELERKRPKFTIRRSRSIRSPHPRIKGRGHCSSYVSKQERMGADEQLGSMIDRFLPDVALAAREAISYLSAAFPGAVRLVYDNYNALAIAFAPSEKAGAAIFSVALYPRWANLFVVGGQDLPDPSGLLRGDGSTMRHIRLERGLTVTPAVTALIDAAAAEAPIPFDPTGTGCTVIKSISAKQRARRPS